MEIERILFKPESSRYCREAYKVEGIADYIMYPQVEIVDIRSRDTISVSKKEFKQEVKHRIEVYESLPIGLDEVLHGTCSGLFSKYMPVEYVRRRLDAWEKFQAKWNF